MRSMGRMCDPLRLQQSSCVVCPKCGSENQTWTRIAFVKSFSLRMKSLVIKSNPAFQSRTTGMKSPFGIDGRDEEEGKPLIDFKISD